jgi:hypothetical protein
MFLQTHLHRSLFDIMRSKIGLEAHKNAITSLYLQGHSVEDVRKYLSDRGIRVGIRTIRSRFNEWNISKHVQTEDTPELRLRIATLFYQCAFRDQDILDVLRAEGFAIQYRALQRIRKKMGLVTRLPSSEREEADKMLLDLVQAELDKGRIEGFGRNHLYHHFRSSQHIVSRFVMPFLTQ